MAKSTIIERAEQIAAKGQKRAARQAAETPPEKKQPKRRAIRGKPRRKAAASAQEALSRIAANSMIEQFDLFPGKEWPTPFCRVPLFPPVQRRKARAFQSLALEKEDFVPLHSKWDRGGIWRTGPALTVYDEDTLLALVRLRRVGLKGPRGRMPDKALKAQQALVSSNSEHDVTVHATYCLVSDVEAEVRGEPPPRNGYGGDILNRRKESIERLGAQVMMFEAPIGLDEYRGKQIQLLALDWLGDESDACYYVQFHPIMVSWLDQYRTFIDPKIRRQLPPLGRALYRFLASQRSNPRYSEKLEDIAQAIGFSSELRFLKRDAQPILNQLVELEFLKAWKIAGTGRRTEFVLEVEFVKKK